MTTERGSLQFIEITQDAPAAEAQLLDAAAREYIWIENQSEVAGEIVMLTVDGSVPTATNGKKLPPGSFWEPVTPPDGEIRWVSLSGTPQCHLMWG